MIDKEDLKHKACSLRIKFGEDSDSPIDIFSLVQKDKNLTLIFHTLGKNISGVCYKVNSSNIIAINSKMSIGRQKFSLAHELYHLYYDKTLNSISYMSIGSGDAIEREADQFASYFLIPPSSLNKEIENIKTINGEDRLSLENIIELEQFYGVSHQSMLYRLLSDGYLNKLELENMKNGIIEKAANLGYDTGIYLPSSESKDKKVYGYYLKVLNQLFNNGRISKGKYEELLIDAFRDDIVYGIEQEEDIPFD